MCIDCFISEELSEYESYKLHLGDTFLMMGGEILRVG